MAKPAVVLIGADKGGVGKTTVSRTLLDYFLVHKIPTRVFDTEYPKGTLKRFHPEITEVVDITSVPAQMKIFDTIYSSGTQITLLDIRAGTLSSTLHTLRDRVVPYSWPFDCLPRRNRRNVENPHRSPVFPGQELHK